MARPGEQSNSSLSQTTINQISQAIASGMSDGSDRGRRQAMNASTDRKKEYVSGLKKEAALARALTTEAGLRKIAANMANPVRFYLDYRGIFRKFAVNYLLQQLVIAA